MVIVETTEEIKKFISGKVLLGPERLFTITVPSQPMVYNVLDDCLEDRLIEMNVIYEQAREKVARGSWALETFVEFVEGVGAFIESVLPFIKGGQFEAEAQITETTYVWSRFVEEKVPKGPFKSETKLVPQVRFEILGLESKYVKWAPDMLDPIMELREEIIKQREDFLQQIRALKDTQH